jgi:hypothetical protein
MGTNYPHRIASHEELETVADAQREDGLGTAVIDKVRQVFCGLHGHDDLLQFEEDRMFLKCVSCGHESPGWELTEVPPTVTARSETRTHTLVRPQLVGARRIA